MIFLIVCILFLKVMNSHELKRRSIKDEFEFVSASNSRISHKKDRFSLWSIGQQQQEKAYDRKCLNISIQMEARINFGPSKFIPIDMNTIELPQTARVSKSSKCWEDKLEMVLEWSDTDTGVNSFYRNLTIVIEKNRDYADNQPFYWVTNIEAVIEVEVQTLQDGQDSFHYIQLKRRSSDYNPFDVVSLVNLSYSCKERRSRNMDTFYVVPIEGVRRQLKSSEIVLEWLNLYLPQHIDRDLDQDLSSISSCFIHSRDYIPKIVGFSLLGVIALIIVFWFVGRRTMTPSPDGYNSMGQ